MKIISLAIETSSPFGSLMPGRSYSSGDYRYGFQGQEKENDVVGEGLAFKYRIHDARIGRFLSVDPLAAKYPYNSQYAFSENRVIDGVELEGLEYINKTKVLDQETGQTFGDLMKGSNQETVDHNGESYYKVDADYYLNTDGKISVKPGEGATKLTEWIYPSTGGAITQSDFVGYSTDCYKAMSETCGKVGALPINGWYNNSVQMFSDADLPAPKKPSDASKNLALNLIHYSLEMGLPIGVGVEYDGTSGESSNPDTDNTTNHFITIYDRGEDATGSYFLYAENVAYGASDGMSPLLKLYVNDDGVLRTRVNNSGGSDYTFNGNQFRVTQVRMSSQLKNKHGNRVINLMKGERVGF